MDMSSDKGVELPPLLINPSAPLPPFQPALAMCEPLEKPDTPTGKSLASQSAHASPFVPLTKAQFSVRCCAQLRV